MARQNRNNKQNRLDQTDQPDQAGQEREERGQESNNSPRGDGAWRGGVDEDEDEDEDEEEQKLKTERLQPRLCVICLERPPGPFLGGSACMVCTFGENHELEREEELVDAREEIDGESDELDEDELQMLASIRQKKKSIRYESRLKHARNSTAIPEAKKKLAQRL